MSNVGIRVRGLAGCPVDVLKAVRKATIALRPHLNMRHRLVVVISPALDLVTDEGETVHAYYKSDFRDYHRIYVAAGSVAERRQQNHADVMVDVLDSLAHELVHYAQVVKCGRWTERGVKVRVRTLLRLLRGQA